MGTNLKIPWDIQKVQLPVVPCVISSGQPNSSVVYTNGLTLCGILIPVGFTGTALTFETCEFDNGTFLPMYNSAGLISYTIATAQYLALNPQDFYGAGFIIIKSNQNEAAERDFFVALRGF